MRTYEAFFSSCGSRKQTGSKSEDVIAVLQRIDEDKHCVVEEVTFDLSDSMRKSNSFVLISRA